MSIQSNVENAMEMEIVLFDRNSKIEADYCDGRCIWQIEGNVNGRWDVWGIERGLAFHCWWIFEVIIVIFRMANNE